MIWVKDSPGRRVPRRPRFLAALVRRDGATSIEGLRISSLRDLTRKLIFVLAGLSAYHFCRALKQSFGLPPHRYHTAKRIEHAKTLLAKHAFSVTDIGMRVGFGETSSFTAAFRKAEHLSPGSSLIARLVAEQVVA